MITFTDLRIAFLKLGLAHAPVIAHASLSAFGEVVGGADTLLRASMDSVWSLVMPTFTYRAMITPPIGPPNNGIVYGGPNETDSVPEPFTPEMPADRQMGATAEALRLLSRARRSSHPILSFAGFNADRILAAQSLEQPLGVIGALLEADGWVLLLGVDHTVNTSIHFAERMAGRKQFIRWALLPDRIVECPGFPGDSAGFQAIAADVASETREIVVGEARVRAIPIRAITRAVVDRLRSDPHALLCEIPDCARCGAVRASTPREPSSLGRIEGSTPAASI